MFKIPQPKPPTVSFGKTISRATDRFVGPKGPPDSAHGDDGEPKPVNCRKPRGEPPPSELARGL